MPSKYVNTSSNLVRDTIRDGVIGSTQVFDTCSSSSNLDSVAKRKDSKMKLKLVIMIILSLMLSGCVVQSRPLMTKEEIREYIKQHRYMGSVGRSRYQILLLEEINEKLDQLVNK